MVVVGVNKLLIDIDWLFLRLMSLVVGGFGVDADFGEEISDVVEFFVLELEETRYQTVLMLTQRIHVYHCLVRHNFKTLQELLSLSQHHILNFPP